MKKKQDLQALREKKEKEMEIDLWFQEIYDDTAVIAAIAENDKQAIIIMEEDQDYISEWSR